MNVHDCDAASHQEAAATHFKAKRDDFDASQRRIHAADRRWVFGGMPKRRARRYERRESAGGAVIDDGYGLAPTARARWRHVESQGKVSGMCSTMRRTERSTQTASLSSRSRSVVTWASAQFVPAARRRNS